MRLALAAALFLSASAALAGGTFVHPNGTTLRLLDTPCVSTTGMLATLPLEVRAEMKAATVSLDNATFEACWADLGSDVYIVDEKGGRGSLGGSPFRKAHDA